MYKPPSFNRWWKRLQQKPSEQRKEILTKWFYYACKTIAHRGDMDQAKVVYTIASRYNNSKFKTIAKSEVRKVFYIVNAKQKTHKRLVAQIVALKEQLERKPQSTKNVVVKRKIHRKITTGGAKYDS